jgi:hypothetical protein
LDFLQQKQHFWLIDLAHAKQNPKDAGSSVLFVFRKRLSSLSPKGAGTPSVKTEQKIGMGWCASLDLPAWKT